MTLLRKINRTLRKVVIKLKVSVRPSMKRSLGRNTSDEIGRAYQLDGETECGGVDTTPQMKKTRRAARLYNKCNR